MQQPYDGCFHASNSILSQGAHGHFCTAIIIPSLSTMHFCEGRANVVEHNTSNIIKTTFHNLKSKIFIPIPP